MKIAQFTSTLIEPLGPAERYVLTLARLQRLDGHEVVVVTGWADDSIVAGLAAEGIRTIVLPTDRPHRPYRGDGTGRREESALARLRFRWHELVDSLQRTAATHYLENAGFDIVHVHRFVGFGTAVLRARGVRVVHTAHDFRLVDSSASVLRNGVMRRRPSVARRLRGVFARQGIAPETTLIFPSVRSRDRHVEWGFAVDDFDSIVIPHGWPAAQVVPEPSGTAVPSVDAELTVLFLGNLADADGLPALIDAWGSGIPGVTLRVAGDGPLKARIDAIPTIRSLGELGDAERTEELVTADVLVFPSARHETFPNVVAEALLAGVPVLSTQVAAPPLVVDGESGLIVAHRAADLRSAIERLAADRGLVARLSLGAHVTARQLDMTKHSESIMDAYLLRATESPSGQRSSSQRFTAGELT